MNYQALSDTKILNYEQRKVAVFEEVKKLFTELPFLLDLWYQDAYLTQPTDKNQLAPGEEVSESFRSIYHLIIEELSDFKRSTKRIIRNTVENFEDTIKEHVSPFLVELVEQTADIPLAERDYIYANTSTPFHLMRNIVTNKTNFSEKETGFMGTELVDNQGTLHGFAELRPAPLFQTEADPSPSYGIDLLETTLSSLDELTADIFDLVSYQWMTGKRDTEGFIEFHSDDALLLRHYEKGEIPEKVKFKERDRFNIMRRVAALSSVWITLHDGPERVKIVNASEIDSKLYNFQDFKRMFDVGSVRIAFDKKTNKPKGIYALQIKPSTLLQPYLDGTKSSLGVLDLKVFKYSYVSQREHKRLTRYLSRQWKIRSIKGTVNQPFKIATLLSEMNFPARLNGGQLRDRFEEVLDDLQRDEVIADWSYTEEIDESRVGKRGWIQNYWSQISVQITPPSVVLLENKKKISLPNAPLAESAPAETTPSTNEPIEAEYTEVIVEKTEQTEFVFESPKKVQELTPEIMRAKIDELGYSIRKAAEEIGISHTTLSRYMARKIKRQNLDNDQKMIHWLEMN
ncbi:hypothetical protein OCI51_25355 (plasmid) [Lysinibacillus capsici]|uniref:hypothetical protein n=1 Tax=Lysinibacillus capsici TaxID=2115968 RepID=UPI0021DB2845|nr:hypothetical protein [Lysinibacillus capsici]UYB50004.1 hypothetical protein OCI51_25355 [Lysinibacillus capsici]